jgi:hypothetical protein
MTPIRRGVSKYLTLEHEAVQILETLAVGPNAQGRLLSTLIREEEVRRHELRKIRNQMEEGAVLNEVHRAIG